MGGSPTNGLVWVFSGLGCHPGGVCASGEETQNGRPGAERPGHHHRHQPEGAQHHTTSNLSSELVRSVGESYF